ncbi:MAG: hypothetical protein WCJ35_03420 [Planctomycetota bacterium]
MNQKTLELAALAAHRTGTSWCDFWDVHRHAIAQAEPWDRSRFHKLVRRLTALVAAGDLGGDRPLDNPFCGWESAEEAHTVPVLVVSDTYTQAQINWTVAGVVPVST